MIELQFLYTNNAIWDPCTITPVARLRWEASHRLISQADRPTHSDSQSPTPNELNWHTDHAYAGHRLTTRRHRLSRNTGNTDTAWLRYSCSAKHSRHITYTGWMKNHGDADSTSCNSAEPDYNMFMLRLTKVPETDTALHDPTNTACNRFSTYILIGHTLTERLRTQLHPDGR